MHMLESKYDILSFKAKSCFRKPLLIVSFGSMGALSCETWLAAARNKSCETWLAAARNKSRETISYMQL